MSVTKPWKISDLVDFEYLCAVNIKVFDEATSRQAEELFQSRFLPVLQANGSISRRDVFRSWLESHREIAGPSLPGEYWKFGWHCAIVASTLLGLGVGLGMSATLLSYSGDVPVNVASFLVCTLAVQLLILLLAAVLWLLRRMRGLPYDFRPLLQLLRRMVSWPVRALPGEQRERIRAVFGKMDHRRETYGHIATWPFLIVTQLFGISFNIGILVVLLAKVGGNDVEFGWQSSLIESDTTVFSLARGISWPWRQWTPHPHPTLAEVIDSHFRYRERRSNTAWWPFLCYSIMVYGRAESLWFEVLR